MPIRIDDHIYYHENEVKMLHEKIAKLLANSEMLAKQLNKLFDVLDQNGISYHSAEEYPLFLHYELMQEIKIDKTLNENTEAWKGLAKE